MDKPRFDIFGEIGAEDEELVFSERERLQLFKQRAWEAFDKAGGLIESVDEDDEIVEMGDHR